jgi:hypothetical protein
MTVKAIAEKVGGKYDNIRQIVYKMEESGDLIRAGGNKRDGYTFQIPHYNNYNQDDKGADSEASCNSCNDCNYTYTYTLNDGDRGTYRTDAQDLETAQAELAKQYGDRLASVTEAVG